MDTTPFHQRSPRRYIWIGLIMLAVGVYLGMESRDSIRTGEQVHLLHSPSLSGWEAAGLSALIILFGGITIAAGFGWLKPKPPG